MDSSGVRGAAKHTSTCLDVTLLENEIDSVVYSLYNLISEVVGEQISESQIKPIMWITRIVEIRGFLEYLAICDTNNSCGV